MPPEEPGNVVALELRFENKVLLGDGETIFPVDDKL